MYYDNKRTFYIKQYGPTLLVSVIALVLISVGAFVYFNSSSKNTLIASEPESNVTEVAKNTNTEDNKIEEETALQDEEIHYFEKLETLVISELVDVASVENDGTINLKYKTDSIKVSMIGIDYKYATDETYNKIRTDLEAKQVKIAFDTQRDHNSIGQVYIYLNDELYNANLLKTGLVTLKSERTNVAQATVLSKAQAYARENKLGIWNR